MAKLSTSQTSASTPPTSRFPQDTPSNSQAPLLCIPPIRVDHPQEITIDIPDFQSSKAGVDFDTEAQTLTLDQNEEDDETTSTMDSELSELFSVLRDLSMVFLAVLMCLGLALLMVLRYWMGRDGVFLGS
ncbi:hypothetical protein NA57DRAFT_73953 [Rhizodiscina lignyota]|uniref:Uncharacterized protein n=1 Tax=Rhizodiscina lignyota TaxID=1504668 RepID=A0A9P4IJC0_9PEZI|nr:hypothetical protein NA57DRAFT_73953 [Rhizodiscina lignyota]